MNIAGTSNVTTTSPSKTQGVTTKDEFLKILVAQLKHQDPLEPMKPDQFLTQLSQLTQVEQLQAIATQLGELTTGMKTGNLAQWFSVVGKKMAVEGSTLSSGDEVTIKPQADFDRVVLALKNVNDGTATEVVIKKGEKLVYTHEGGADVTVSAVATKNGMAVPCKAEVFRLIRSIEVADKGPRMVAGNGDGYYPDQVKGIKD